MDLLSIYLLCTHKIIIIIRETRKQKHILAAWIWFWVGSFWPAHSYVSHDNNCIINKLKGVRKKKCQNEMSLYTIFICFNSIQCNIKCI